MSLIKQLSYSISKSFFFSIYQVKVFNNHYCYKIHFFTIQLIIYYDNFHPTIYLLNWFINCYKYIKIAECRNDDSEVPSESQSLIGQVYGRFFFKIYLLSKQWPIGNQYYCKNVVITLWILDTHNLNAPTFNLHHQTRLHKFIDFCLI